MGKIFQFKVLPFGLPLAWVFSKCVQVALESLQRDGIRILPYLDDWLVCAASPEQAREHAHRLLRHITALGFRLNQRKCKLDPVQLTHFIGVTLDSNTMVACPTPDRIRAITSGVKRLRAGDTQQYVSLLRLLGKLAAATAVIPLGLLWLRSFQKWLIQLRLCSVRDRHVRVPNLTVPQGCLAPVNWQYFEERLTVCRNCNVYLTTTFIFSTDLSLSKSADRGKQQ
ncbi:hypothetical protein GJAV_G00071350 [Gymnothorax javanicus]|nr:hypothetical protein GJAV_G00071350 [Gymnothorax javanicus]